MRLDRVAMGFKRSKNAVETCREEGDEEKCPNRSEAVKQDKCC